MDSAERHFAARVDDVVNALRNRLFRRRGWLPRLVPYTGYGSTRQVRVLARILLAPPIVGAVRPDTGGGEASEARQRATRGWRRFLTTPIPAAEVEVDAGGRTHHLVADRRGYVDARIDVELTPGWHNLAVRVRRGRPSELRVLVVGDEPGTGGQVDHRGAGVLDEQATVELGHPAHGDPGGFAEHERVPRGEQGPRQVGDHGGVVDVADDADGAVNLDRRSM